MIIEFCCLSRCVTGGRPLCPIISGQVVCYCSISIPFISRDRVAYDIRFLNFAAYRDASREGEGKGKKREKRLPYDPEYESLQGVSNCCAKTHRRAYHVTLDLGWLGQQLPYSSLLYVFTEYSTNSVDEI